MTTTQFRSRQRGYGVRYSKMYRSGHRLSVSPIGDMRRIQALRRIGYSTISIAGGTGLSPSTIRKISQGKQIRIGIQAHKKIVTFYEEHSWHPRVDTQAKTAAAYAKKWNWAPPGAWDDIDNPEDTPKGVLR